MKFIAACIQSNCKDDLSANVAQVIPLVREAAEKGATFIALPENAFLIEEHGIAKYQDVIAPEQHPGVLACAEIAKQYGAWILIGSIAVSDELNAGRIYNTSVLLDATGEIHTFYKKIHLFDVDLANGESYRESKRVSPGASGRLVELPWGKLGLSICYDIRFPQLYRQLSKAGADLLAVPAAFTKVTGEAHWHVLLRARAIENGAFVFAPAQWGEHPGKRMTYGHSMIVDPWGRILADAGEGVGVITAEIDMDEVRAVRGRIPSLNHDREFVIE